MVWGRGSDGGRGRGGSAFGAFFALVVFIAPGAARADGAFPDSETVIAPADRPAEILLGTNFGLLTSADGGQTWTWSCEQALTGLGRLYQRGPPPDRRLFAIANGKLVYSDDEACGWQAAGGMLASASVQDAFADPTDPSRVLAIALAPTDGGFAYVVTESGNAGTTFDTVRYRAAPGQLILGLETARSHPATIYLTLGDSTGASSLARSNDGGVSWQSEDLSTALGPGQVRIVAVDPTNPDRVYLRWIGTSDEALVVTGDGGTSVKRAITFSSGALWSFARTSAGRTLAAGVVSGSASLYRSEDGATFTPLPGAPGLRAMAERAGVIYAATDNMNDQYIDATSSDDGETWSPGLATANVAAIAACVKGACRADCLARATAGQWPASMCDADPPPPAGDSGPNGDAASQDAGAAGDALDPGTPNKRVAIGAFAPAGCRCSAASGPSPRAAGATALVVALALVMGARRRRPVSAASRRR